MALPGETPEQEAERLKRQAMQTQSNSPSLSVLPQAAHTGPEDPRGLFAQPNARRPYRDTIRKDMSTQEAAAKRAQDFSLGVNNNPEVAAMIGDAQATGNRYASAWGNVGATAAARAQAAQDRGVDVYRGNTDQYQQGLANAAASRGMQTGSYGALMDFANQGQGPSAAQAQLTQATDMNARQQLALARSGRGMGGSQAALRSAMDQGALAQQQAAGQMAELRANEYTAYQNQRLNAMQAAGGLASQTAQTDQGFAGQGLAGAQYASDVALKGTQLNDAAAQAWATQQAQALNQGLATEVGAQNQTFNLQEAALNARQNEYAAAAAQAGVAQQAAIAQQQRQDAFVNSAIAAGGTALGAVSDERSKQNITPLGQYRDSGLGSFGAAHPAAAPTQVPGDDPGGNSVKAPAPPTPGPAFTQMRKQSDIDAENRTETAKTVGSTAGKVVGAAAGTAVAGPIGGIAGAAIGGVAGKALGKVFSDVRAKKNIIPLGGGGGYDFGKGFIPLEQEAPSDQRTDKWIRNPNNPSEEINPYAGITASSHSTDTIEPERGSQLQAASAWLALQRAAAKSGAVGIAGSPEAVTKYAKEPAKKAEAQTEPDIISGAGGYAAPTRKGPAPQRYGRNASNQILSEGDVLLADSARNAPGSAYDYKEPGAPGAAPGTHVGPMAQDLAAHPVTAGMVSQDPGTGKLRVDGSRAALTGLAQNHSQQNQIDALGAEMAKLNKMLGTADKVTRKNTPKFKPSTNYQGL